MYVTENESVANISNVLTTRNHAEVLPHQKKHFKGNNVSSLGKKNTRKEQGKICIHNCFNNIFKMKSNINKNILLCV